MPPFVGVAVKVTVVPEQMEPDGFALMLTAGTTVELTTMVIELEVAVVGLAQDALDVRMQVMISPFTNVLLEYVVPPVPTLLPFFFHW